MPRSHVYLLGDGVQGPCALDQLQCQCLPNQVNSNSHYLPILMCLQIVLSKVENKCILLKSVGFCGDPGQVENSVRRGPISFKTGDTITYICNPGYQIIGDDQITCLATGQWTIMPLCTRSEPPLPPTVPVIGKYNGTSI